MLGRELQRVRHEEKFQEAVVNHDHRNIPGVLDREA
jgi:hypothetical protein